MSLPVLSSATSRMWVSPDQDPPSQMEGVEMGNFYWRDDTKELFFCTVCNSPNLTWKKVAWALV